MSSTSGDSHFNPSIVSTLLPRKCGCNLFVREGAANTKLNYGRRFSACPRWNPKRDGGDCGYFQFHDEVAELMQLEELKNQVRDGKVMQERLQNELLLVRVELEEKNQAIKKALEEQKQITKKLAEQLEFRTVCGVLFVIFFAIVFPLYSGK